LFRNWQITDFIKFNYSQSETTQALVENETKTARVLVGAALGKKFSLSAGFSQVQP
jgi:hypothetical protein